MTGFFTSHGSPTILIEESRWKDFWRRMGEEFSDVESVVVISPHFFTYSRFYVEVQEKLESIRDFYGFPDELYRFRYSTSNNVDLAHRIFKEVREEGLPVVEDTSWGLDHGAWIPLMYMFPKGKPTVPISISGLSLEDHVRLGRVISRAVEGKVLVMGTGSPTHRLDLFQLSSRNEAFLDPVLSEAVSKGVDYVISLSKGKEWRKSMPEGDLKPLLVVMGYSRSTGRELLHDVPWPGVSMVAYLFG
ncbi:hypothetical protein IC006_0733 [Sulfuracidifex tepidarius]|uniref:Extradiol ring-cleavage dioxygenase class III enzyme subunit B domain-containing protein n=1 Tax=Sulfuracidifex tepidarius TaxID=1294262 RepID=A0A510DTE6_9CREN|nr:class III extradiol ring-cleavage dioxygenase [Sulfuracidifex tepidarius]BBG23449.1 hypothetical protein IC006_0733 [Sulfuracidifex tepidarius]